MKTLGLIVLGSMLTIAIQLVDFDKISLLSNANAAGKLKACRVVGAPYYIDLEIKINNLFRFGYRVKGVGNSPDSVMVVMCRG